jgi:hypothetical protein
MGEVILKTTIPRENNYIYYCSTDKPTGCLTVMKSLMKRHRKGKDSKR